MSVVVLVGGARSGKSSLAVEIGRRHQATGSAVTVVATAPAVDDDMAARIERHRAERPAGWATIEEPVDLVGALGRSGDDVAIVDCLTLWVSNLMWRGDGDDDIEILARRAASAAGDRAAPTIVVTNEVGLGVHPDTDLGRRYRDLLGRVNATWAAVADTTLLLVAGRALELHDPARLLGLDHLAPSPPAVPAPSRSAAPSGDAGRDRADARPARR
ncbi:bifunctional adenosylcobinamide kinase/adenosylcobinamide-phosphate guanylyltransferase [Ilumatobacter sp.]|uniref:bifunctional adenosylcobinamide kinase/adenosylcobinamide-phosphate guanylyltransferase n=1 Tax=Ilumatobacter sp. TaxID=1967498 RepID=UPI003B51BC56